MPNSGEQLSPNKRGPAPVFTERMVVRLRPDQSDAIARIAKAFQLTPSELVRMWIDLGSEAVESVPTFKILTGEEPAPWAREPTPCSEPSTR